MVSKRLIIVLSIGIIFLVLVGIGIELFFLYKLNTKRENPSYSQTPPHGSVALLDLPMGYFFTSTNQMAQNLPESYMLLARLVDVKMQNKYSILAHITFATYQGTGKTVIQPILISPGLILSIQNSPEFLPPSNKVKTTIIKNPQDELTALQQRTGKAMLFSFNTFKSDPKTKPSKNNPDPQCNNVFLLTLSFEDPQPTCLPFTQHIRLYESF